MIFFILVSVLILGKLGSCIGEVNYGTRSCSDSSSCNATDAQSFCDDGNCACNSGYYARTGAKCSVIPAGYFGVKQTHYQSERLYYYGVATTKNLKSIVVSVRYGNLMRSDDYGHSWRLLESGTRDWRCVSATNDLQMIVAAAWSNDYLYASRDGGKSWSTLDAALARDWEGVWISGDDGSKMLATDARYIHVSTDNGISWHVLEGAGYKDWRGVVGRDDLSCIAGVSVNGDPVISRDRGATFTTLLEGSNYFTNSHLVQYRHVVASEDWTSFVVTTTNKGMWKSTNSGQTWRRIDEGLNTAPMKWFQVAGTIDLKKLVAPETTGPIYHYDADDINRPWVQNGVSRMWLVTKAATNISACAVGKWAAEGSFRSCETCSLGYTTKSTASISASNCSACPPGKFGLEGGTCEQCDVGLYSESLWHANKCVSACGAGKYTMESNKACVGCPPGRYSTEVGATSSDTCIACTPGKFTADPGSTFCENCPMGTASAHEEGASSTICVKCPKGFSSSSASATCIECAEGTFSVIPGGAGGCSRGCTQGLYANTTSRSCEFCPAGRYNKFKGQKGVGSCTACQTGRYNPSTGSTGESACKPCLIGKYNPMRASTSPDACLLCPAGRYQPNFMGGGEKCRDCPAGLTSSEGSLRCYPSPTGEPTSVPSASPSGQPTAVPTGAPTNQPTSFPTMNPTHAAKSKQVWTGNSLLSAAAIQSGTGLFFSAEHEFHNIGHLYDRYYLSLFVYDTGFGPVELGQYVKFYVNDEVVKVERNESLVTLQCAPVVSTTEKRCAKREEPFRPCAFNVDVTRYVKARVGGSLKIEVRSYGVVSSACPYFGTTSMDSQSNSGVVFTKYVLSALAQETPVPTFSPTPAPSNGAVSVYQGFQMDFNKLNVWQLLQISLAVGLSMGVLAAVLCNIRKKAEETVYQHPLLGCIFKISMLGAELTSMIFLIIKLTQSDYSASGIALGVLRLIQCAISGLIVLCVFHPTFRKWGMVTDTLDFEHMATEFKPYILVAVLCFVDVGFVALLPWKNSKFANISKGFPSIWVWQSVEGTSIASILISIGCQIPYLQGTSYSDEDILFILNLFLLTVKLLGMLSEHYFKRSVLIAEQANGVDVFRKSVTLAPASDLVAEQEDGGNSLDEVVMTVNPMLPQSKQGPLPPEFGTQYDEHDEECGNPETVSLLREEIKTLQNENKNILCELATINSRLDSEK